MIHILFSLILGWANAEDAADPATPPPAAEAAAQPAEPAEPAAAPPAAAAPASPPAAKPAAAPKGPAKPEDITSKLEEMSNLEEESLVSKLTKPFIYEREDKRDPFSAPEAKPDPLNPGPLFGPMLELQEIQLADVTLKGIYLNPTSPKALISYPSADGTKKILKKISVGDYLGENYGIVSSIRDGQVIIVQTLEEGNQKSTTTRALTIRK